jgi:hypothetical protein
MFFIGDRFFGTVAAHVAAPQAERFRFTSALPAQILRSLEPALQPLLQSPVKPPALTESSELESATGPH